MVYYFIKYQNIKSRFLKKQIDYSETFLNAICKETNNSNKMCSPFIKRKMVESYLVYLMG